MWEEMLGSNGEHTEIYHAFLQASSSLSIFANYAKKRNKIKPHSESTTRWFSAILS